MPPNAWNLALFDNVYKYGAASMKPVAGLAGRVIRGSKPEDFTTLTDDPNRKTVMLMDSDGLHALADKNGYDSLIHLGYSKGDIEHYVGAGKSFKLVVFDASNSSSIVPATWDNIPNVVRDAYQNRHDANLLVTNIRGVIGAISKATFDYWNIAFKQTYGSTMQEVLKAGDSHPGYMTLDRFMRSSPTALNARAFLYFTLSLRELFAGDGYTYTNSISPANRGLKEYFCANQPLANLGERLEYDLEVRLPSSKGASMATNARFPSYYDPTDVPKIYHERLALVEAEAIQHRTQYGIKPSNTDRVKVAAFGIDCQIGFCTPGASLFVPGAVEDTQRTVEWIYRNIDKLTSLFFSMDTHRVYQIFHPGFWADANGNHPAPFTPISYEDVRSGKWIPLTNPREALEYTKQLKASASKYLLNIWPYHTLLGGVSHALVPALFEAACFHALTRRSITHFETKGSHTMTENYSVMSPEVKELGGQVVGEFNTKFFKMLMDFDVIYVFGQAKSHCLLSTLKDILAQIMTIDPSLASKIRILVDATSPVPAPPLNPLPDFLNFPVLAEQAFREFEAAGMKLVTTADDITA